MSAPDMPGLPGSSGFDDLPSDLRARLDAATGGALSGPDPGEGPQHAGGPGRSAGATAGHATSLARRRLLFGLSTFVLGAATGVVGHALISARPQPVAVQLLEPTPASAPRELAVAIPLSPVAPSPVAETVPDPGAGAGAGTGERRAGRAGRSTSSTAAPAARPAPSASSVSAAPAYRPGSSHPPGVWLP